MNNQLSLSQRLHASIPGGAHTYSKGDDQFPSNAPRMLTAGNGVYVIDENDNKFLDYGMGLRSVSIGYSEDSINKAAFNQIQLGNNLTRASYVELEAAEKLISLIPSVEMVKFTKNGSTAVSAAVKLSRAYTGKDKVLRCLDHPFFSYDDWFIGSTPLTKGIPDSISKLTMSFKYNDINALQEIIENTTNIACLVMEAATSDEPVPSKLVPDGTFLNDVQYLCNKHNIIFILDEMITGFRWHLGGAQSYYNIQPDLSTFGKAMANGFSVAAVGGKRELMSQGSILDSGAERVFLLSTTHGAEMCGLGAFLETMSFIEKENVISHFWEYGDKLITLLNNKAKKYGLESNFKATGFSCSPTYQVYGQDKKPCLTLRTLFNQEMIKNGVMMPWIAIAYRHGKLELKHTSNALEATFEIMAKALNDDISNFLQGPSIKPVFRKYN
jgi:glutamate-1-semialdehyde 2,1-aminomutase